MPSGRYPDRSFMGDLVAAAHRALDDAGLTPRDVDTIVLIPCLVLFLTVLSLNVLGNSRQEGHGSRATRTL